MRHWLVLIGLVAVSGCTAADFFTAHPEWAAEAGRQRLRTERLAQFLADLNAKMPVSRRSAQFVAETWVDYSLFAQAFEAGTGLTDSVTAARAKWSEIVRLRLAHLRDTLTARRRPPVAKAESAYAAGDRRLLQHILVSATDKSTPQERAAARQKARQLLARIVSGADFGALAFEYSDDRGTRADSGYLQPAPRGAYIPVFDSAGWALSPGARTNLVETRYGYHIIRRPPFGEVRDRWLTFLAGQDRARQDSLFLTDLIARNRVRIASDVPTVVGEAFGDREGAGRSKRVVATYEGGVLTVAELMQWIDALGPLMAQQVQRMRGRDLTRFVTHIVQTQLVLRVADSAGIGITPAEWSQLVQGYRAEVDTLGTALGLAQGQTAGDSSARAGLDSLLDRYFTRVASGQVQPRPISPSLAELLRSQEQYRLVPAGVSLAASTAAIIVKQRDTTAASKKGLRKAPGPAPTPHPSVAPAVPGERPSKGATQ